jgi:hypothetical protein
MSLTARRLAWFDADPRFRQPLLPMFSCCLHQTNCPDPTSDKLSDVREARLASRFVWAFHEFPAPTGATDVGADRCRPRGPTETPQTAPTVESGALP